MLRRRGVCSAAVPRKPTMFSRASAAERQLLTAVSQFGFLAVSLLFSYRGSGVNVRFNHLLQRTLCMENVFHRVPPCSVAAARRRLIMCHGFHLRTRIRNGNGQSATAHNRQIDYVIANVCNLLLIKATRPKNLVQYLRFVFRSLKQVINLQVACADGYRFRNALGYHAGLQPAQPRQGYGCAVVRIEALGFNHVLAENAETGSIAQLSPLCVGWPRP